MISSASPKPSASANRGLAANLQENIRDLEEDIRKLARTIYELCGREEGHDLDNWVCAERRIKRGERNITAR